MAIVMLTRTIRIRRHFPVDKQTLWKTLTDPDLLGRWLMRTDFVPIVGHSFTFNMKPQKGWDGITHCDLIELELGKTIAYTYRGHATGEKPLACAGVETTSPGKGFFFELDTVLRFGLVEDAAGTMLSIEQSGFRGWKLVLASFVLGNGWKRSVLPRLADLLAGKSLPLRT